MTATEYPRHLHTIRWTFQVDESPRIIAQNDGFTVYEYGAGQQAIFRNYSANTHGAEMVGPYADTYAALLHESGLSV